MHKTVICLYLMLIATNASCYEISATSSLLPQNGISYSPYNLTDNDPRSAWCAKFNDTNLVIKLRAEHSVGHKVGILNGYAKNKQKYSQNARVKEVTIATNKLNKNIMLGDSSELQIIDVDNFKELTITIKSVYSDSKIENVCISEIILDKRILSTSEKLLQAIKLNRARTKNEIKTELGPIYSKNNEYLERSIGYFTDHKSEQLLRLLVDFNYYQTKFEPTVYAELAEGIDDVIQSFFKSSADIVEAVLNDPKQLNKKAIADNFDSYLQRSYPYDDFDSKTFEKKLPSHLKKLKKLIAQKAK